MPGRCRRRTTRFRSARLTSNGPAETSRSWPWPGWCTRRWLQPKSLPRRASRWKSSIRAPWCRWTRVRSAARSKKRGGSSLPTRPGLPLDSRRRSPRSSPRMPRHLLVYRPQSAGSVRCRCQFLIVLSWRTTSSRTENVSSPASARHCKVRGAACRPRQRLRPMLAPIVIADSVTRVGPNAAGAVIVNGSHGGVYAAFLAAKLAAAAAIFNDAGVGHEGAGIAGLDYLQELGMPAATVGHDTARIGDGADMMMSGIITHANMLAAKLGVKPGQPCREAAGRLQQGPRSELSPPEALEGAYLLISVAPEVWALDSA